MKHIKILLLACIVCASARAQVNTFNYSVVYTTNDITKLPDTINIFKSKEAVSGRSYTVMQKSNGVNYILVNVQVKNKKESYFPVKTKLKLMETDQRIKLMYNEKYKVYRVDSVGGVFKFIRT